MTRFRFKPLKEISIQQISQTSVEDLVKRYAIPNHNNLMWVDGILFIREYFPQTDDIISHAALQRKIIWKYVEFAKLDKYPKTLVRPEGTVEVDVSNVETNPVFVLFAKWLKRQSIWKRTRSRRTRRKLA